MSLALCLHQQLKLHASACRLLIVHDDVTPGRNLSSASLSRLSTAVDLMPLSRLMARAFASRDPAIAWNLERHVERQSTMIQQTSRDARHNRLLGASNKYWLWALTEYEKVAYLDLDLLILKNIDGLLHLDFSESIAAVSSAPLCKQHDSFNSGVLVIKPSLQTLAWLLLGDRFSTWPWKGRVPRFTGARLGPDGPVAVVARNVKTGTEVEQWAEAWGGNASIAASKKGRSTSSSSSTIMQVEWRVSWAEHCAPIGCTKLRNACLLQPTNGSSSSSNASNTSYEEQAAPGLEACKKRTRGSYSWSHRLRKTCEPSARDQSVLNWYYNKPSAWKALPRGYNVQPAMWTLASKQPRFLSPNGAAHAAIVHFVGDAKPWASGKLAKTLPESLAKAWKGVCAQIK